MAQTRARVPMTEVSTSKMRGRLSSRRMLRDDKTGFYLLAETDERATAGHVRLDEIIQPPRHHECSYESDSSTLQAPARSPRVFRHRHCRWTKRERPRNRTRALPGKAVRGRALTSREEGQERGLSVHRQTNAADCARSAPVVQTSAVAISPAPLARLFIAISPCRDSGTLR